MSVCVWMHACEHMHSFRPEGMTFLQLELGNCELPDTGTGNQKWVLYKSNTSSQTLSHLSRPQKEYV